LFSCNELCFFPFSFFRFFTNVVVVIVAVVVVVVVVVVVIVVFDAVAVLVVVSVADEVVDDAFLRAIFFLQCLILTLRIKIVCFFQDLCMLTFCL
jgi:hypothetical protein